MDRILWFYTRLKVIQYFFKASNHNFGQGIQAYSRISWGTIFILIFAFMHSKAPEGSKKTLLRL
jgi:hypothetical protein